MSTHRRVPVRVVATLAVAIAASIGAAGRAGAQGYFGQNQVQYDHFDWHVLETEHFLVHYYPSEREAAVDASRMAERVYARLSRILDHQFREKKPIVLFASRADFGQNNVTGDLGEGTGGVTEALRHRMLLPFTGDYRTFEHVLAHEMVHEFQYDIYARGKAGGGLQTLQQFDMPYWFAEGMAEYLSIGPKHPFTDAWIRDAALNGNLPTIEQMTLRPDKYFPYRYGEALWAYVGERWGDEVIGAILQDAPNMGYERAIKRELGLSLEDLSDEWREAMQVRHLPQVASLDRPRKFAQPLLTARKSGGQIFLAPSLSSDGKYIAFLSNGNFLRGQVFIDLWLGDGRTGKRLKRLVKSTTDPNFEELQLLYSQSAFSPDGHLLAFTAMREGKDVLYLLDVGKRKNIRRFDLPLETVVSPSFSPDGRQIVFSGSNGGITDLYTIDTDGGNFRRLTNDRYGDLQPQWSPDGRTIAFVSDRGPGTNLALLEFNKWQVTLLDVATGDISVIPGQAGLNTNPQWAPDGQSIAYVSDRTGIANVFLYDIQSREHYQLTNVVGAVSAITEVSPSITWARKADRLAFTYYQDGDYTVWSVDNPRLLRKEPFHEAPAPAVVAGAPGAPAQVAEARPAAAAPGADTAGAPAAVADATRQSYYRAEDGFRPSAKLDSAPANVQPPVTVAALLDSADFALPDTARFRDYPYHVRYQPDYVARPSIGYAQDNFGRGVFGGTTIVLSDLLGNNRLALAAAVNGSFSEAQLFGAYTNLGHRLQYVVGASQDPFYLFTRDYTSPTDPQTGDATQELDLTRYLFRQAFSSAIYPLNRFTRFEFGLRFTNIDRTTLTFGRTIHYGTGDSSQAYADNFSRQRLHNEPGINYFSPSLAYVSDNTLFGYTGPIFGRRYRFQIEPALGSYQWMDYSADYRRYDPILFNFLTVATRVMGDVAVGRDEGIFPKYIGNPLFIRGYDRQAFTSNYCIFAATSSDLGCSAVQLMGSRVALFNAELRFPLIRRFELGLLPIALPPLDGLFFYDAGLAWSRGQTVYGSRPENYDLTRQRYPLRSYGFGLRLNLFNYTVLRWDYAKPLDSPGQHPIWTFSLGPSF